MTHSTHVSVSPVVTFTVTQAQQNVAEGFLESVTFATGSESDCFQTVSQNDANKVVWRISLPFIRIRSKSLPFCFSVELIWDTCLMMVRDPQGSDTASILPRWRFSLKTPRPPPPEVELRAELPAALRAMRRLSCEEEKSPWDSFYPDLLCKKEVIMRWCSGFSHRPNILCEQSYKKEVVYFCLRYRKRGKISCFQSFNDAHRNTLHLKFILTY